MAQLCISCSNIFFRKKTHSGGFSFHRLLVMKTLMKMRIVLTQAETFFGGSNHRPPLVVEEGQSITVGKEKKKEEEEQAGPGKMAWRKRGRWRERKEGKQVVDERVSTTELEILTSPPAAPNHPDLLFPLYWDTLRWFSTSLHLSPRLIFHPHAWHFSPSPFPSVFVFAPCLSVSPAAPSLFFWKLNLNLPIIGSHLFHLLPTNSGGNKQLSQCWIITATM